MDVKQARFAKFSFFSAILFILSLVFALVADKLYVTKVIWAVVPFFYAIGLITRKMVFHAIRRSPRNFSNVYMLLTLSRLVLYVVVMVVYSYFVRADAYPFMITFFVFYACFTVYEMIDFHKIVKS